ncbi:MAG: type II toxin-antitoxin system YafQ family toxin [Thermodesulfovibrionales bacterium]
MYRLVFTESYQRREAAFIKKHPELVERYKKILKLLEANPAHPALRLHKLKGKFLGKHAVSINFAYRIVIAFVITENEIIPVDIGRHDDVYWPIGV